MARSPETEKIPPPSSRLLRPLSVFYLPPKFQRERMRRGKDDYAGPFVVELPLFMFHLVWGVLRVVAYLGLVAGRIVALPFRSAARKRIKS